MYIRILTGLLFTALLLTTLGCKRDVDLLEPAKNPAFAEVYLDEFVAGLDYSAFANSKYDAFSIDKTEYFKGTSSIKITVPDANDPSGWFAGGVFYSKFARDLSGYNALTFWGKADKTALADVGFGNDNAGNELYAVMQKGIVFGTSWKKYIIPIPLAEKLTAEKGMLQYAAGADANGYGGHIWMDEIRYEKLGTIAYPRPAIASKNIEGEVGEVISSGVTGATFNVDGVDQSVDASAAYFTFTSSDESVAKPTAEGKISALSVGTAKITVKLGDSGAADTITVNVIPASPKPAAPAPTPTVAADSVISLFSNAYTNVTVDTWNPFWQYSTAEVTDLQISGDDVKRYTKLNFVGIEFTSQTIDASAMTHFHIDMWTPDPAASAEFEVKLVDFGADNAFGGDDDSETSLKVTSPDLVSNAWVGVDVPLAGLSGKSHLAQLILVGNDNLNTVYVDNAYFYIRQENGGTGNTPTEAAPAPTQNAADVVSLFSNAYTDVTVDTWSADWDQADLADVQVAGDDVKLYTNLVYAGVEFTSSTVDASAMTHFHLDMWTPDPTTAPTTFKIKLVDFGADGAYDGGDDVEHELSFDATSNPALATGSWVSFDIPLADFTGLTSTGHLAQLIISSELNTVYVDNIYFYKNGGSSGTEPTQAAPTPTQNAADVVSLFSNAYTNVTVDTWSADWDQADLADVQVAGDDVKLYTNLVYAGVEFTSSTVDASAMTHFHLDMWTPDPTTAPAAFKIKLVDFGADGAYDGGDDVEHELTFDAASNPALATGSWVSFDIPLADFTGLTSTGHLAQLIISSDLNTVYVDNIYFYKNGGSSGTEPTQPAPTPSFASADVISLFSNAYTNVTVDTWSADWDQADLADVQVAGDDVKLYTNLVYAGVEFTSSTIDGSAMTHFHLDLWTPDPTTAPAIFKIKLVDFGADGAYDGGDDVEQELTFDAASNPALATGSWVSFDIPLTDFTGLTTQAHLAQLIVSGDPNTVYLDNILLHK